MLSLNKFLKPKFTIVTFIPYKSRQPFSTCSGWRWFDVGEKGLYWPFTCQLWHIGHFISSFFWTFFLCGMNRLYVWLSLSHDFDHFGSLHMWAPRKDIGRSEIGTRYPRALSQPRYQWAIRSCLLGSQCPDIIMTSLGQGGYIWPPQANPLDRFV